VGHGILQTALQHDSGHTQSLANKAQPPLVSKTTVQVKLRVSFLIAEEQIIAQSYISA